jgi:hypothetical protein
MNFWNNPQYSSVKIVVIIAVIAGLGYFGLSVARNSSLDQSGRVYEEESSIAPGLSPDCSPQSVTFDPATTDSPSSCTVTDCFGVGTTYQFETDIALSYIDDNWTESAMGVASEICSGTLVAPFPTNGQAEKGDTPSSPKQPMNKATR